MATAFVKAATAPFVAEYTAVKEICCSASRHLKERKTEKLPTQTRHPNKSRDGSQVDDPAAVATGSWFLFFHLFQRILAPEIDALNIDLHVRVEYILSRLIDRQGLA